MTGNQTYAKPPYRFAKMSKDRVGVLQQAHAALGALLQQVTPAAPPAAGALGKADMLKSIEGLLTPVIEGLSKLGVVVKQSRDDIETIKKSRGVPNGNTQVETTDVQKAAPGFAWPLDMTSPVTRETTNKMESFFGDDSGK